MYEDIGRLLGKGFETWRNNLRLCVPFLLNVVLSILALIPIIVALALVLYPAFSSLNISANQSSTGLSSANLSSEGSYPADLSTDQILSLVTDNLATLIPAFVIFIVLELLISAFFTSGAIGMAKQATKEGKTSLGTMWSSGRKNVLQMLIASILITIITLAGAVFLLPAILALPSIMDSSIMSNPASLGIVVLGVILLIIYGLAVSMILSAVPYALVVDGLGAVQAIRAGVNFFMYNKSDVFMLWLIVIAIGIGMGMLGGSTSLPGPAGTQVQPWSVITGIIDLFVLAPVYTVWWTRLYMSRTGKLGEELRNPW